MDAPKFVEFVEFPWTVLILTEDEVFDPIRLLDPGYRRFLRWKPHSEESLRLKEEYNTELNPEQRQAIEMALRSKDYSLILGMPGTGKTATTAVIVRCLVALGQSVLITSHTHTAVDNLLLKVLQKISKDKVSICRIGRVASVKSSLREFCLEEKMTTFEISDLSGLHSELTNAQIVGTTSLAIKHVLFSQRKFDVCIVDEAGQILEPVALGPLRTSDRFVMIGDHHQLPPLVKSESAKKGGMDVSLFKRLAEKHPLSVTPLTMQYRMNADIMTLANMLVYGGRLRCGSKEVQNRKFVPPHLSTWRETNHVVWLSRLLDPNTSVLFVNTDSAGTDLEKRGSLVTVETEEAEATLNVPQVNVRGKQTRYAKTGSRTGGGIGNVFNEFEADRVYDIVDALLLAGATPSDMCVISPYNAQVRLIRGRLSVGTKNEVDVDTVDRFQGQDKNIVIFSFVRSNSKMDVGALLADIKRLNVAITRPRQKFVLVGSASTLSGGNALLQRFIEEGIRKRGWLQELN
jgi:DNA replication ATP-dependent helicase Dna2